MEGQLEETRTPFEETDLEVTIFNGTAVPPVDQYPRLKGPTGAADGTTRIETWRERILSP